jgi:hypothetical protein
MQIQILTLEGCPNAEAARALVEEILADAGIEATIQRVDVVDAEDAARLCFIGSPTIRVDGVDVQPAAEQPHRFQVACRVYRSGGRLSGLPHRDWIRDALLEPRRA